MILMYRKLFIFSKYTKKMDKSKIYLDKETLEREEQEAKERGLTIFQLRKYKKWSEIKREQRRKNLAEYRKKKKLEREKELRKLQKQKEKEKKDKQLAKEKERLKLLKKKEREKEKREKEKLVKKRKPGRPKKLGRKKKYYHKKKKTKKVAKQRPTFDFKIVACRNGRQSVYIGKYKSLEDAYEKLKELKTISDNVIFPVEIHHRDTIKNAVYEYLILEKDRGNDKENAVLRNEFGKLVEHKSTSTSWVIVDKMRYNEEESFWVWGYNNKTDRKDFAWIYKNLLLSKLETEYDMMRIILFKNKIIFKDDESNIDIVFCKTTGDGIRFYNKLEELVKRDKLKQVYFLGSYNKFGEKRNKIIEEIAKLTGWDREKISLGSTSKHTLK